MRSVNFSSCGRLGDANGLAARSGDRDARRRHGRYGIRLLGDFEDTAHRSDRARKKLLRLKQLLETEPAGLAELRTRARQASTTMLADVESWRVTVESRNLSV